MNSRKLALLAAAALCFYFVAARSAAQETITIDFEDLAVGTTVTTQYDGVTFSAPPDSCGGDPPIRPTIVDPSGSTSSGTHALSVTTGCPDFSPDYLRIVFERPQSEVTFVLGGSPGTYAIRAYTTTSGSSGEFAVPDVTIPTGSSGVNRFVRVTRAAGDMRRVEIDSVVDEFEVIDDLTFDCGDATPPLAEISAPLPLACVCYGNTIRGTATDPDGELASWRLERKAPDAETWTLISLGSTPIVDDRFSEWYPSASAAEGYYNLRLTVTNRCGLISTATTIVWLDRQFDSFAVRSPTDGLVLGGTVWVDGTAWDHCGGSFTVESRPLSGIFTPIDTVNPPWVLNDPLGTWNTADGEVDGTYEIRVSASDACSQAPAPIVRTVTIDNTRPIAVLTSPRRCSYVNGGVSIRGTASDANFGSWSLSYTGGDAADWVPIATGISPVLSGEFATWDTRGLRECAYTLRLVVTDRAIRDWNSLLHNTREYTVAVNLGAPPVPRGDINCDGLINFDDIDGFVACLVAGGCAPCP